MQDGVVEIYLKRNEGKSVTAERLMRTLKNKIYKYMTVVSKNVCIGKIDDIIDKYNNTYHKKIENSLLMIRQVDILTLKILMLKIIMKILNLVNL